MSFTLNGTNVTYTPGNIIFYAGITAPNGWLLCDGSSYNTTTYSQLFSIVGYLYGGSGSTFKVPNMVNQFLYGASSSVPISNITTGSNNVTLSITNIPAHTHTYKDTYFADNIGGGTGSVYGSGDRNYNNSFYYRTTSNTLTTDKNDVTTQLNTGSTGSSTAFSIIPESIVFNYIIKI